MPVLCPVSPWFGFQPNPAIPTLNPPWAQLVIGVVGVEEFVHPDPLATAPGDVAQLNVILSVVAKVLGAAARASAITARGRVGVENLRFIGASLEKYLLLMQSLGRTILF